MVYLLQSPQSDKQYDSWLCGGCIISDNKVLTSAACLNDVSHVYVIAGYRFYVNSAKVDSNRCTRRHKRRVIKYCSPGGYNFSYSNTSQWMNLDVAVATVDRPFNFTNRSYRLYCSYVPQPIRISYNSFYQTIGTPVRMFGWGHLKQIRKPGISLDLNSMVLNVGVSKINDKVLCKRSFKGLGLDSAIDKWMLCVSGQLLLDSHGLPIEDGDELNKFECSRENPAKKPVSPGKENDNKNKTLKLIEENFTSSVDDYSSDYFDFRRKYNAGSMERFPSRRNEGLCENDHGGPLVTWSGDHEVVIGVAISAAGFQKYVCDDPSLFISTHCLGMILECLITSDVVVLRSCSSTARSMGYEIVEKEVVWADEKEPEMTRESFRESTEDKLQPSASNQNETQIISSDIKVDDNSYEYQTTRYSVSVKTQDEKPFLLNRDNFKETQSEDKNEVVLHMRPNKDIMSQLRGDSTKQIKFEEENADYAVIQPDRNVADIRPLSKVVFDSQNDRDSHLDTYVEDRTESANVQLRGSKEDDRYIEMQQERDVVQNERERSFSNEHSQQVGLDQGIDYQSNRNIASPIHSNSDYNADYAKNEHVSDEAEKLAQSEPKDYSQYDNKYADATQIEFVQGGPVAEQINKDEESARQGVYINEDIVETISYRPLVPLQG